MTAFGEKHLHSEVKSRVHAAAELLELPHYQLNPQQLKRNYNAAEDVLNHLTLDRPTMATVDIETNFPAWTAMSGPLAKTLDMRDYVQSFDITGRLEARNVHKRSDLRSELFLQVDIQATFPYFGQINPLRIAWSQVRIHWGSFGCWRRN